MPKVTVLMPNYNAGPYIEEAIESILNQSFKDFIFLIIDDGSTDNSREIIKTYLNDSRIKYIEKENTGFVDTLNYGLRMIETEYFVRMDSDDLSRQDRIEKLVQFMDENHKIGVCGSNMKIFGEKINTKEKEIFWEYDSRPLYNKAKFIFKHPVAHASCIFRTGLLKSNNIEYRPDFKPLEDYDLFFRLNDVTLFSNILEPLYSYRRLFQSYSDVKSPQNLRRFFKCEILRRLDISEKKSLDIHYQLSRSNFDLTFSMGDYKKHYNLIEEKNTQLKKMPEKELSEYLFLEKQRFFYRAVKKSKFEGFKYLFHFGFSFKNLKYLLNVTLRNI